LETLIKKTNFNLLDNPTGNNELAKIKISSKSQVNNHPNWQQFA